jgi:hypothetical protein
MAEETLKAREARFMAWREWAAAKQAHEHRLAAMFPSTEAGDRGSCSPLGGVAQPAEKPKR